MKEDSDSLDQYFRKNLKNGEVNETPFFDYEEPRRNNMAEQRLNLRHYGAMTPTDPYLPDGTFLDYDFLNTETDEPDFTKAKKHREFRTKYIKFNYDGDDSVHEGPHSAQRIENNKKYLRSNMKNNLKIFDTSLDNISYNTPSRVPKSSLVNLNDYDQNTLDIAEQVAQPYDFQSHVSKLVSPSYGSTSDQILKVSKYGSVRGILPLVEINEQKNRENNHMDHDVMVSYQDQMVLKSVVLTMKNLINKKANETNLIRNTVPQDTTRETLLRRRRQETDLNAIIRQSVAMVDGKSAEMKNKNYRQQEFDFNRMNKVVFSPQIMRVLTESNKKSGKQNADSLKESMVLSGASNNVFITTQTRKQKNDNNMADLLWSSRAEYEKGNERNIANYAHAKPYNGIDMPSCSFENYAGKSMETIVKNNKIFKNDKWSGINRTYTPQEIILEHADARHIGSRKVGNLMNQNLNDINESMVGDKSTTRNGSFKKQGAFKRHNAL